MGTKHDWWEWLGSFNLNQRSALEIEKSAWPVLTLEKGLSASRD